MWKLVVFMLAAVLWTASDVTCQCDKERDVMVVIELPHGNTKAPGATKRIVQDLKTRLDPTAGCNKLGFIFVWRKVQAVLNMRCNYRTCYRNGLAAINRITRLSSRVQMVYDKRLLAQGLQNAASQLYSEQEGARKKAEKVIVLILSNPPVKGAAKTEEEVKDYHDMRIKFIAVGVGAGRRENLADIVVNNAFKSEFDNMADLANGGVGSIAKNILAADGVVLRSGYRGPSAMLDGGSLGSVIGQERMAKLTADKKTKCTAIVDIAFIMDSSGSVRNHYMEEKFFVQRIASRFEIIEAGSHGGVILFSSHGYIKTVIKFTDFLTTDSFNQAVQNLPFYGYMTRIDTALKLAHTELYTKEGRARPNVKKLLFLITDGRQNPDVENGRRLDPAKEAEKLHLSGVQVYAVGIGSKVNFTELELVTKDKKKVYQATDFQELVSDAFVTNVSKQLCEDAANLDTYTVTMKPFTKPVQVKDCNNSCKCGSCGCCPEKAPVYINVFRGANNQNYLVQGASVKQNGNTNSLGALGFNDIRSSPILGKNATSVKDLSSKELSQLVKDLLPYQQHFGKSISELLRRALAKESKKRRRRQAPSE